MTPAQYKRQRTKLGTQERVVPADEWDEWDASTSIGAKWDKADEPAIFAKARALGWEAPQ